MVEAWNSNIRCLPAFSSVWQISPVELGATSPRSWRPQSCGTSNRWTRNSRCA